MTLRNKMRIWSTTLTVTGFGTIWYLIDWRVTLALLVLLWGQNLQGLIASGHFNER